jgi:hypothetical protein
MAFFAEIEEIVLKRIGNHKRLWPKQSYTERTKLEVSQYLPSENIPSYGNLHGTDIKLKT